MDNSTEPTKPPLLLPEPQKNEGPIPDTLGAPDTPDTPDTQEDQGETTEIEPRPEQQPREEIEHNPRERLPAGRQGGRGRRDHREHRGDRNDFRGGQHNAHRPRPFIADPRRRSQN